MTGYNSEPNLQRLLAEFERRLKALETAPRAPLTAVDFGGIKLVDDGSIYTADNDGNQTLLIGKQFDGTYGVAAFSGPTPPTPTAPIVSAYVGGISITWDGSWEDAAVVPMDFSRIEVHISSDIDFEPSASTLTGTIETPLGATVQRLVDSGDYYIKFVARTTSGKASLASEPAYITPLEATLDTLPSLDLSGVMGTTIFRSTTEPDSPKLNDIWIVPPDNITYRYEVTTDVADPVYSWVEVRDQGIIDAIAASDAASADAAAALASADGKTTNYYSDNEPVAPVGGFVVGDTWFDTNDGNKIRRWDGAAWTTTLLGGNAVENLDAGTITVGTLNADRISANSLTVNKLIVGSGSNLMPDPQFTATTTETYRSGSDPWVFGHTDSGIRKATLSEYLNYGVQDTAIFYPSSVGPYQSDNVVPVIPESEYIFSIPVFLETGVTVQLAIEWYDDDNAGGFTYVSTSSQTFTYSELPALYDPPTPIAFTAVAQGSFALTKVTFTAGPGVTIGTVVVYGYKVRLEKVLGSDDIGDGTVINSKLSANAVSTDNLSIGVIASNLIKNPGFEDTGQYPSRSGTYTAVPNWTLVRNTTSTDDPFIYGAGTEQNSGVGYAKLRGGTSYGTSDRIYTDMIEAQSGDQYLVKGFAKSATATSWNMSVGVLTYDANGNYLTGSWLGHSKSGANTYIEFSETLTVPTPGGPQVAFIAFEFYCTSSAEDDYYIDSVFAIEPGIPGVEITPGGIKMWNSAGEQTIDISGDTANISAGSFSTGLTGNRVIISDWTTIGGRIALVPADGTGAGAGYIDGTVATDGNGNQKGSLSIMPPGYTYSYMGFPTAGVPMIQLTSPDDGSGTSPDYTPKIWLGALTGNAAVSIDGTLDVGEGYTLNGDANRAVAMAYGQTTYTDTSTPTDYPAGITMFTVESNSGTTWPLSYAVVETIKIIKQRVTQIIRDYSGREYIRDSDGAATPAWGTWRRSPRAVNIFSGTTDANGYLTVTHSLGYTPSGVSAFPSNSGTGGPTFPFLFVTDNFTTTTFRARALGNYASSSVQNVASTAVSGVYIIV